MSKNFSRHKNSKKHKLKEVRNGGISEVQNRETEVQNGGIEVQKNKIYTKRKGGDRSKAPRHEGADIRDSSTKLLPKPS